MKKGNFIFAVLCGIMLISLAGCGKQSVLIQPEANRTSGTETAERSLVSSQSSHDNSAQTEQTESADSKICASVPHQTTEQENPSAGSSASASTSTSREDHSEQSKPQRKPESMTTTTQSDTPASSETSRPTGTEPDKPVNPSQTEDPKPTEPTKPPVTEPTVPVYTQADYDHIIQEATAYAKSYAEKGFTFEWKDSMEFGWDVGYMGTPRIEYEGVEGTISRLKNHIDKIVETSTDPANGITTDYMTYKVVQITIDGDIAFAVIYGG